MPTFKYPRVVLELDVPRKQCVFTGVSSGYYGREMRIDQVDTKDVPPEGGMVLPASENVWQEPLTGFIGLKPDFLYDSQAEIDSVWEGAENTGAWPMHKANGIASLNVTDTRSKLALDALSRACLMKANRNGYTSKYNASQVFDLSARILLAQGNGLISLLTLVAIQAIIGSVTLGGIAGTLMPLLRSENPMMANQGFRIFCAAGNSYLSKCPTYLVVRFGRFLLTVGTDGAAKLYGLPYAESWATTPNTRGAGVQTLGEWQFAAKPGNENVHLTVLPIQGNLCFYLQTPDVRVGSLVASVQTHRNPGLPLAKVGHVINVPKEYLTGTGNDLITTQAGRLTVFGNASYSYNLELFRVQYPTTGTYYTPAEQLEQPTLAGQTGTVEGYDFVPPGDQGDRCTITGSLVNGDVADINGKPTAWNMATSGNHPRGKFVLTRPAACPFITPYHRGHNFKFEPVFMPDNREQLTFYQPYRVSITQNRQQSTMSAHADLVFGLDGRNVPVNEDWETLAAAFTLFTERPDSPFRLWCEIDAERANDILLMAGYLDDESPPVVNYISDRMAKFTFTMKPEFARLNESHFTRTNIYDGRSIDYALRDMLAAAGYDCASQYQVESIYNGLKFETFPNEEGELTNRYRPKQNAEMGKVIETALSLFDTQNSQYELAWVTRSDLMGTDGRKAETWQLRARPNPPSFTSPPAVSWNICLGEQDMGNHTHALLVMERPTLRIFPVAANVVRVITDASGDNGSLEIGAAAFNTGSVDMGQESLADPAAACYLGRYKRLFLIAPDLRGAEFQEAADALAEEALEIEGWPYYEMDVVVPWQPTMKPDDYVQVWYSSGAAYKKFWIKEISVDFDDSQTPMARLTLITVWQRERTE